MEIEAIGQSHKPALLQDGYVAQLRKQNLVNRRVFHRKHEDHQLKATPGINSEKRVRCPTPQQCGAGPQGPMYGL